jgi:hypothetical protein
VKTTLQNFFPFFKINSVTVLNNIKIKGKTISLTVFSLCKSEQKEELNKPQQNQNSISYLKKAQHILLGCLTKNLNKSHSLSTSY